MAGKQVLVYELNAVPWIVMDRFLQRTPGTRLASILRRAQTYTTYCNDPNPLEPWRTWPTFHTGLSSDEHHSLDLGQDPTGFGGKPIWDIVARQGLKVGVFGALQSWPARTYASGGFYVPDTFARTPQCVPDSLTEMQAFNLRFTRENLFSADAPLTPDAMVRLPGALLRAGVRFSTCGRLGRHVFLETLDPRQKAARPMMQAELMFDIFMHQMCEHDPRLSIFFTNHVAAMMHRYWADAMAAFGEKSPYAIDPLHSSLVWKAMEMFDRHLGALEVWANAAKDRVVIVASSMGQGPIPYKPISKYLVLRNPSRLLDALGCRVADAGLAMYPAYSLRFRSDVEAESARSRIRALRLEGQPLFQNLRRSGSTLRFDIMSPSSVEMSLITNASGSAFTFEDLGIVTRERLGGTNTAHNIPEGTYFAFGAGQVADAARRSIDVRSVRSRILDVLGCEVETVSAAVVD